MMRQGNVKVLYGQAEELAVGQMVDRTEDLMQIRDSEGNKIEIPVSDFKGVVLQP